MVKIDMPSLSIIQDLARLGLLLSISKWTVVALAIAAFGVLAWLDLAPYMYVCAPIRLLSAEG